MSSCYEIGYTTEAPTPLDELGLPNPHPVTFKPFDAIYVDGRGKPTADGYATATWHFDALTMDQLATLLGYLDDEQGGEIRITTRTDFGTTYANSFATIEGYMWRPVFGEEYEIEMGRYLYTDITIKFTGLFGSW